MVLGEPIVLIQRDVLDFMETMIAEQLEQCKVVLNPEDKVRGTKRGGLRRENQVVIF